MKILFVHDHIFLTRNGKAYSNTFSYGILKRYIDVFSEVTFVARQREVEDTMDLPLASGEGVHFIFLKSISSVGSYFGLRNKYKKVLENLMADHDGVIVRLPSELGLMASSVAQKMHKKCLGEVVGCAWGAMWNYGGWHSKIYAPLLYMKMRQAVKGLKYVAYVTEDFLQKRYPAPDVAKTIGVSDVEVDVSDEKVIKKRMEKIERLPGKITFGTIANLDVGYKGIDVAMKTLAETLKDNFEYRLIGAGDTAKHQKMAKHLGIHEQVYFDGIRVGGDAVSEWLDTIDIYLQPSKLEGLPRALVEAMSRGCPAIGSSVGGIPELLDSEMIFEHKDLAEFKKLIVHLANKEEMKWQAVKNYERAKDFDSTVLNKKRNAFLLAFRKDLL